MSGSARRTHLTSRRVRGVAASALPLLAAAGLLAFGIPAVTGTSWPAVARAWRQVSVTELVVLVLIWFAGLSLQTIVQTGALPGLTYLRALQLNLSGSAVANIAPAGGALGIGLNYAMLRSWGLRVADFGRYTLITNIVAVLVKLFLPPIAVLVLLAAGPRPGRTLLLIGLSSLLLLVLLLSALLSERAARGLGRCVDAVLQALAPLTRGRRWPGAGTGVSSLHTRTAAQLRERRWRLVLGATTYAASQALLLYLCLVSVGGRLPVPVVLAGYGVERVLTALPVTPGGSGLADTGSTAVLVALGGAPATTAAAVLAYRAFVVGLEVPVGGMVALGWLTLRWASQRKLRATTAPVQEPAGPVPTAGAGTGPRPRPTPAAPGSTPGCAGPH